MTPEEHYKEAERWLAQVDALDSSSPASARALELYHQRALIHATLANAPAEQVDVRLV